MDSEHHDEAHAQTRQLNKTMRTMRVMTYGSAALGSVAAVALAVAGHWEMASVNALLAVVCVAVARCCPVTVHLADGRRWSSRDEQLVRRFRRQLDRELPG